MVPMPMLQVVQIALMVVGLFFETDVEVGLDAIAKFDKEEEPLDNTKDRIRQRTVPVGGRYECAHG